MNPTKKSSYFRTPVKIGCHSWIQSMANQRFLFLLSWCLWLWDAFFFVVKLLRRNGVPSSRCLQIKVNYDSVSSSLKAKGVEAPEKADQDFQSSLVVSASSSSIHSRHAQMRVLLASFICSVSPLSVPLHLHMQQSWCCSFLFGNAFKITGKSWI